MIAEYFMRSAIAPTISAGVMMANIIWYIEKTFCETQYGVVRVGRRGDALEEANVSAAEERRALANTKL